MIYKFHAYGHPNILGAHKTTLEFTKDKEVSLKGDCIIGVDADFDLEKIRNFTENSIDKKITITIKTVSKPKKLQETVLAEFNPSFNDETEFVIRKTDFVSERTFATSSDKAAFELNRGLINHLKEKKNKIAIIIENKEK